MSIDTVDPRISNNAQGTLRIVCEVCGLDATQSELIVTLVNMVFCEGVSEGIALSNTAMNAVFAQGIVSPTPKKTSQSHDYTKAEATER